MRKKLFIVILMILLLCMTLLSGCASFDRSAYVQAALDSLYKGEHTMFSEITKTDTSILEQNYEDAIDAEMESFLTYMGIADYTSYISEETRNDIRLLIRDVYSHASYSVGSEDENGTVTVRILPIDLYSSTNSALTAYMDDFFEKNDAHEFSELTDEEFYTQYITGIIDILRKSLDDITYTSEVSIPVVIEMADRNVYSISQQSLDDIDSHIINYNF